MVLDISNTFYRAWNTGLLYKFRLYGVRKRCFILLSHFLIVKDFDLFWGTRLMRVANSGIPFIYISLILRPFWYNLLEINKRKWNKAVRETECFICKLKSIKATFDILNFWACTSFPYTGKWNSNGELWWLQWINLENIDFIVYL